MKIIPLFLFLLPALAVTAQQAIYTDMATLITGAWHDAGSGGASTLSEVTTNAPYEGAHHYQFDYAFNAWWAGLGLNMDKWGTEPARNLSGYTHLRIAYRGLAAGQNFTIKLRNNTIYSNEVQIGSHTPDYTVVDIPVISLTAGTTLDMSAVREIDLSIGGLQVGSGTVYFDAIQMVNASTGSPSSANTLARASSFFTGINATNWLEAYWLIPFGSYPEFSKYNRTNVSALRNAGFEIFRLPITVERITPTTAPYTVDFNQTAFHLVDSMILWANLYNFKLIIDNHHGYNLTDANFQTELPRLQAIWSQLAAHYNYLNPDKFFFEIYNEPTPDISNTNFRTVANALVASIRANETQTHTVFVGANSWNSGDALVNFTPLDDPDIIYTFHCYDPFYFTHQGMSWTNPPYFATRVFPLPGEVQAIDDLFAAIKDWSDVYGVPVSLGEYGCSTAADAISRCNWIEAMSDAYSTNNFSNFYWDAITPSDAFGFYNNGIVSQANVIPCFASALGLYQSSMAVEFGQIQMNCRDDQPLLRWSAYSNAPGDLFVIERSNDGAQWEAAGTVQALQSQSNYAFQDDESAVFYRLYAQESDGSRRYTPIQKANCSEGKPSLSIFPNPAISWLDVEMSGTDAKLAGIRIYDLTGRLALQWNASQNTLNSQHFSVEHLPAGQYLVQVLLENGQSLSQKLILEK